MKWVIKGQEIHLASPLIMGILNVTPDSFSDGGEYFSLDQALQKALQLIQQGADIIDIGGESTRPGSEQVSLETELARTIPVIEALSKNSDTPVSIDTQKSEVAEAAIRAGAHIVNDVSGGTADAAMFPTVAQSGVGYVMMHMKGTPKTMQNAPVYGDVLEDIRAFFLERIEHAGRTGINKAQIVLDPGIGFGKTLEDNLRVMANMNQFNSLGYPILLGASRKSFINMLDPSIPQDRLGGSLAAVTHTLHDHVNIYRVHDVLETRQAIKVFTAIQSYSD